MNENKYELQIRFRDTLDQNNRNTLIHAVCKRHHSPVWP